MKKTNDKLSKEILFYARKLPPIKQTEVLDFIKWLWVSPDEEFTESEWKKVGKLSKQKGKTFKTWEEAEKHLKTMMK